MVVGWVEQEVGVVVRDCEEFCDSVHVERSAEEADTFVCRIPARVFGEDFRKPTEGTADCTAVFLIVVLCDEVREVEPAWWQGIEELCDFEETFSVHGRGWCI